MMGSLLTVSSCGLSVCGMETWFPPAGINYLHETITWPERGKWPLCIYSNESMCVCGSLLQSCVYTHWHSSPYITDLQSAGGGEMLSLSLLKESGVGRMRRLLWPHTGRIQEGEQVKGKAHETVKREEIMHKRNTDTGRTEKGINPRTSRQLHTDQEFQNKTGNSHTLWLQSSHA